jgi:hypothetical protein
MILPLEWRLVGCSTREGSNLAFKYYIREELADVTNTLAYYDEKIITTLKFFII